MKVKAIINSVRLTINKYYEVITETPASSPTHYRIKDDQGEEKTFNMNLFITEAANDEN